MHHFKMSYENFESIDLRCQSYDHLNFVTFLEAYIVEAMSEYNLCTPGHFATQYI